MLTYGIVSMLAVVCYAADRNELRSRVIQWLQTEIIPDGWFVKGSNFSDILLKYFKVGLFPKFCVCVGLFQTHDRPPNYSFDRHIKADSYNAGK